MRLSDARLAEAFVALADTLTDDFDVIELSSLLTRECTDLLEVEGASVLLADREESPYVAAASSEAVRSIGLAEVGADQGPGVECFRSGSEITADLTSGRWPAIEGEVGESGLRAVHALPMRWRERLIGAMTLFGTRAEGPASRDVQLARALTDVATIGILQERRRREAEVLAEQLQGALNTRVVVEQAKGVLAARGEVDMEAAFQALRRYSRHHRVRIADIAQQVVTGDLEVDRILTF